MRPTGDPHLMVASGPVDVEFNTPDVRQRLYFVSE